MSCPLPPRDLLAIRLRLIETPTSPRHGPGVDHGYSLAEWGRMLLAHDRAEHADPPLDAPRAAEDREARVKVLEDRARRRRRLFNPSDTLPPPEAM